jgi:hypothetical protein
MTDIPGQNPGEYGKRQYEIQLLTPNLHREGERWRPFGEPYDEFAKAEYAVEDIQGSVAAVIGEDGARIWRNTHVRVMEKITTVVYGKQMALTDD